MRNFAFDIHWASDSNQKSGVIGQDSKKTLSLEESSDETARLWGRAASTGGGVH